MMMVVYNHAMMMGEYDHVIMIVCARVMNAYVLQLGVGVIELNEKDLYYLQLFQVQEIEHQLLPQVGIMDFVLFYL
jgi:hypothetical protein